MHKSLLNADQAGEEPDQFDSVEFILDVTTGLVALICLFGVAFVLQRAGWPMFNYAAPWVLPSMAIFFVAGMARSRSTPEHPMTKALYINAGAAVAGVIFPPVLFWIACLTIVTGAGVACGRRCARPQ